MSPAERRAKKNVEKAISALKEAAAACYAVDLDDRWSRNDWNKLGSDCENALSYLPRPGTF